MPRGDQPTGGTDPQVPQHVLRSVLAGETRDGPIDPDDHLSPPDGALPPAFRLRLVDRMDEVVFKKIQAALSDEAATDAVVALGERLGLRQFNATRKNAARDVRRMRDEMSAGTEAISSWPWAHALDALDLTYLCAFRAARRFDNRQGRAARKEQDVRFEALARLSRRALLVSSEVRLLLRHGYPIGALARWRAGGLSMRSRLSRCSWEQTNASSPSGISFIGRQRGGGRCKPPGPQSNWT